MTQKRELRRSELIALFAAIVVLIFFLTFLGNTPERLIDRADDARLQGNAGKALSLYSRVINSTDDTYWRETALLGRAEVYHSQLQLEQEAQTLSQLIEAGTQRAAAYRSMAALLACWGEEARCQEIMELGRRVAADPENLEEMPELYSLYLGGATVRDLSGLSRWPMIRTLSISMTRNVTDFTPLQQLPQLTNLYLIEDGLTDISFLSEMKNLKVLQLISNDISDVSPLAGLTGLEELWLGNNGSLNYEVLSGLTNTKIVF